MPKADEKIVIAELAESLIVLDDVEVCLARYPRIRIANSLVGMGRTNVPLQPGAPASLHEGGKDTGEVAG